MSFSDCERCWDTPCGCGYQYREYSADYLAKWFAAILSYKDPAERAGILEKARELAAHPEQE